MKYQDDDESLERELFALRADAMPAPKLDVDDVFARMRPRKVKLRALAWISGPVVAAAAMFLAVATGGDPSRANDVHAQATEEGDGLACHADDRPFSYEVTYCVARP